MNWLNLRNNRLKLKTAEKLRQTLGSPAGYALKSKQLLKGGRESRLPHRPIRAVWLVATPPPPPAVPSSKLGRKRAPRAPPGFQGWYFLTAGPVGAPVWPWYESSTGHNTSVINICRLKILSEHMEVYHHVSKGPPHSSKPLECYLCLTTCKHLQPIII